jgi:hypothetical protein
MVQMMSEGSFLENSFFIEENGPLALFRLSAMSFMEGASHISNQFKC